VSVVGPKVTLSCIHSDNRTPLSCQVDLCPAWHLLSLAFAQLSLADGFVCCYACGTNYCRASASPTLHQHCLLQCLADCCCSMPRSNRCRWVFPQPALLNLKSVQALNANKPCESLCSL
jgi:hypothetical protein